MDAGGDLAGSAASLARRRAGNCRARAATRRDEPLEDVLGERRLLPGELRGPDGDRRCAGSLIAESHLKGHRPRVHLKQTDPGRVGWCALRRGQRDGMWRGGCSGRKRGARGCGPEEPTLAARSTAGSPGSGWSGCLKVPSGSSANSLPSPLKPARLKSSASSGDGSSAPGGTGWRRGFSRAGGKVDGSAPAPAAEGRAEGPWARRILQQQQQSAAAVGSRQQKEEEEGGSRHVVGRQPGRVGQRPGSRGRRWCLVPSRANPASSRHLDQLPRNKDGAHGQQHRIQQLVQGQSRAVDQSCHCNGKAAGRSSRPGDINTIPLAALCSPVAR